MESIQRYWKRTDKVYLLLCLFSSGMAVLALASWAAKQGNGFAVDGLTGQITGVGDYRRAMVQAGAAAGGLVAALRDERFPFDQSAARFHIGNLSEIPALAASIQ